MNCAGCKKSIETKPTKAGNERVPHGWKRHAGQCWCPKCWQERWVLRAVTIPVVKPLGDGVGWDQLRDALREVWGETTAATNWMVSQLFVRDEPRRPGVDKCPKMRKIYLYPETRHQFPNLSPTTAAALENSTKSRYAKRRYEVLWTCEASLPNARYPQPAITPNQAWSAIYQPAGKDGGDPVPCVSLALMAGKKFLLQLRGGRDFRRQLGDFKQISDGVAIPGELAVLRRRASSNDRRNGTTDRDSGAQKQRYRVMVKMVAWFPRLNSYPANGVLTVRTQGDCFAMALDEKANKIRVWNADHVRRWIAEHRSRLQRWSEDQKAEQRPVASFQSRREAAVLKFRNRISSFIREISAQIAGVSKRMHFACVQLDDSDRSYIGDRFDWSGFRTYLAQRLNQDGVTIEFASDEVAPKTQGPLAGVEHDDV